LSGDVETGDSIRNRDGPLPRLAVVGIAAAAGLIPLNSTMIAVALPDIADEFDMSIGQAGVLVTVYLVAMLLGQPAFGPISDRIGPHRVVNTALIGFAACSVAAALAASFGFLVAARVTQALFGAALMPSIQSLLRSATTPANRGQTFGMLGSLIGVGAALGPVVGGVLTELVGWQAIFLVNLPFIACALGMSLRYGAKVDRQRQTRRAGEAAEGVNDNRIINRVFVAAFSTQALTTEAQYTLLLLTPVILTAQGWGSGAIGLALSGLTVGMIVFGPLGGRAGDRHGRRVVVLLGVALAAVATTVLLIAGSAVEPVVLVLALTAYGIGLGGAIPNVMTAALDSVDEVRSGSAAGVLSMSRYVGSITASLAFSALVATDASGSRSVLTFSVAAMTTALLVATVLPGPSGSGHRPGL
jgi:MFS family permease